MDFNLWLSFVGTVLIVALTPGPSVLLVTAKSMQFGSKKTVATILGDLSANLCQIILASAGLATLIITAGDLFQWIKWLGVAYLIFIGLKKIILKPKIELSKGASSKSGFKKLYFEGFMMSAANPKAIIFFAALFPLFINPSQTILPQVSILTMTFLVLDGTSLLIYARFAQVLGRYLRDQKKVHWQNRITGLLLIFSGIMLSMVKKTNN